MATTIITTPPHASDTATPGPTTADAFLADRQAFWGSFTSFVTMAAIGIAILLILMTIFLV
jgi:hypothetical protein